MEACGLGVPVARPVALAIVIFIAGCSGITGHQLGASTPTQEPVTPAPVPTPLPTAEPDHTDLAPGLTTSGVVEPIRLGDAHVTALANRSYTASYTVVRTQPDGSVSLRYSRRTQLPADRGRYCYQTRLTVNREAQAQSLDRRIQQWSDGDTTLRAIEEDNQTRYRIVAPSRANPGAPTDEIPYDPAHRRGIVNLFDQVNTTITNQTTTNARTEYVVEYPGSPPLGPVSNVSLTARIDDTGLVHTYRIEYDVIREVGLVHTIAHLRYSDIGSTSVDRPAWAGRALANETINHTTLDNRTHSPWC